MAIVMDQTETSHSIDTIEPTNATQSIKIEDEGGESMIDRSENNDDEIKQSVYEAVIGANDQELARRQYTDDDENDLDADDENSQPTIKRLASGDDIQQSQVVNCDNAAPIRDDSSSNDESNDQKSSQDRHQRQQQQQQQQQYSSDEPEQIRKLFIGGLDYKTSEDTLKHHFEKFGEVIDCVVMREPQSRRSRGFGFVIYANSLMVDKAQEARPHEVDGREVQSKRAISREDSGKPEAQATVKKVYLGGISDEIEESELREYFKEFGNIVNINIVAHKDTGKRRGFAFVEYDDYDPVDKIVLKKYHTIKDKRIEAKKAIPKVEMDARKRVDPRATMSGALIGPAMDGASGGRVRGPSGRGSSACLWDAPFSDNYHPSIGYPNQVGLDGYPHPHYHSPSSAHYAPANWPMHGAQGGASGGLYGFRGSHSAGSSGYGRNSYASHTNGWQGAVDYANFPDSSQDGRVGPMRLSYQHRSWAPYGNGCGGSYRSRGYNP